MKPPAMDNRGNSPDIPTMREEQLIRATYPTVVGEAMYEWDKAKLAREKVEADLFAEYKIEDLNATGIEITAKINANPKRIDAVMNELAKKTDYYVKKRTFDAAMR